MKIPTIIYNDKLLFKNVEGITLFPFIILKEKYKGNSEEILKHEFIHIKQQIEMLVIPFFIIYLLEWFVKLFKYGGKAYNNISFEREAYANEDVTNYTKIRKFWAWTKYL